MPVLHSPLRKRQPINGILPAAAEAWQISESLAMLTVSDSHVHRALDPTELILNQKKPSHATIRQFPKRPTPGLQAFRSHIDISN